MIVVNELEDVGICEFIRNAFGTCLHSEFGVQFSALVYCKCNHIVDTSDMSKAKVMKQMQKVLHYVIFKKIFWRLLRGKDRDVFMLFDEVVDGMFTEA